MFRRAGGNMPSKMANYFGVRWRAGGELRFHLLGQRLVRRFARRFVWRHTSWLRLLKWGRVSSYVLSADGRPRVASFSLPIARVCDRCNTNLASLAGRSCFHFIGDLGSVRFYLGVDTPASRDVFRSCFGSIWCLSLFYPFTGKYQDHCWHFCRVLICGPCFALCFPLRDLPSSEERSRQGVERGASYCVT